MKTVNFIIDDGNSYFAAGLRLCIAEYARDNNKTIRFLAPDSKEVPDVLFASSSRCIRRWRTPWHAATVAQSVIIEEEKGDFAKMAGEYYVEWIGEAIYLCCWIVCLPMLILHRRNLLS